MESRGKAGKDVLVEEKARGPKETSMGKVTLGEGKNQAPEKVDTQEELTKYLIPADVLPVPEKRKPKPVETLPVHEKRKRAKNLNIDLTQFLQPQPSPAQSSNGKEGLPQSVFTPQMTEGNNEKEETGTILVELSSSNTDSDQSHEETGKKRDREKKRRMGRKDERRSRSTPSRRRRPDRVPLKEKKDESQRGTVMTYGKGNYEGQRSTSLGGEGSSQIHDAQNWVDAWQSAEDWNRWHQQCVATLMHQKYSQPVNVPNVASPIPKYSGKKGGKKEREGW